MGDVRLIKERCEGRRQSNREMRLRVLEGDHMKEEEEKVIRKSGNS